MQRRRSTRSLKEGSSVKVSALAFIIRLPMVGSAAQCGINPQCMSLHSLPPLWWTMTGMFGEVSGVTLKRGVYFGRPRSRFQRTRISLNSNVAVKRPHMIEGTYSVELVEVQGQSRRPLRAPGGIGVNALLLASDMPSILAVRPALHTRRPPSVAERKFCLRQVH